MRVVVYTLLSLDGVAEEPGDWMLDVDEDVFRNLAAVVSRQEVVLLGRGTYDYWVGYWPTSDVEPFASFVNGTPKHVVTSRPLEQPWQGALVVDRPVAEHVAALRAQEGGDVGVHGSITLARSLLRDGLVDELRLVVAPTVAGRGRHLLGADGGVLRRLDLTSCARTPTGSLLLAYDVRR